MTAKGLRRDLAFLFDHCERERLNFIIRPRAGACRMIQLDDLDLERTKKIYSYSFLVVETSPDNYQVWLAADVDADFVRRLKRGIGADPGASGAVRMAGSLNFKPKYAPHYPRVSVAYSNVERPYANVKTLEKSGLVAAPLPIEKILPRLQDGRPPNAWPDYQRCVEGAPQARAHDGPDYSRADFTWAKIALEKFRWIQQPEKVVEELLGRSPKAQEQGIEYARLTVASAIRAITERGGIEYAEKKERA
jgi:hypothetical protein